MGSLVLLLDCNDAGLSSILTYVKNSLNTIHIFVPILLIVIASIRFAQAVNNPDDKKVLPRIKNIFLAAAIVFFIPMFVDVLMQMIGMNTTLSSCWNSVGETSINTTYQEPETTKKKSGIISDPSNYQKGVEKPKEEGTQTSSTSNSSSTSTQTKTPSSEDQQGPTSTNTKYGPALKGSGFSIGGAGTTGGCSNSGVVHDLSIGVGNPIYAGMDGEIQYIQYLCNGILYSYGNQARLTDSSTGTYILYGHLSQFVGVSSQVTQTCHEVYGQSAKCGAAACSSGIQKNVIMKKSVKKGELIGYTGNTGNSEGPHLHVEIHEGGSSACVSDPYAAMGMR